MKRFFSLEDYLEDHSFREWVYRPTPELDQFWQWYQLSHPDQEPVVEHARTILLVSRGDLPPVSEPQITALTARIVDQTQSQTPSASTMAFPRWLYAAAASVLLLLGIGWWLTNRQASQPVIASRQALPAQTVTVTTITHQTKENTRLVNLPDGSTVLLQPYSTLRFAREWSAGKRDVYLVGEATFDVLRNPERPFLVYAGNVVTKVLGTRFVVRAYDKDALVTVTVKSGRVAVSPAKQAGMRNNSQPRDLVLTPNQQARFDKASERMVRTVAALPEPLVKELPPLEFSNTPVAEVFRQLEKVYQINIDFDEHLLSTCTLTASFDTQNFFEQLQLICASIEATYELRDGQVLISSKGCQ